MGILIVMTVNVKIMYEKVWNKEINWSLLTTRILRTFYLCKVIDVGVATKCIVDKGNHCIESGSHYIKCQYFEKIKERDVDGQTQTVTWYFVCASCSSHESLSFFQWKFWIFNRGISMAFRQLVTFHDEFFFKYYLIYLRIICVEFNI